VDDIDYTCNVPVCPYPCTCFNGVVDCKDKDLIEIPRNIPETTIELSEIVLLKSSSSNVVFLDV
jgi:hypothetical protein